MAFSDQISADADTVFLGPLGVDAAHVNGAINETLRVMIDQPHEVALSSQSEISASRPQIHIRNTDAGNVDKDSTLTINGIGYAVFDIQPADAGGVVLILLSRV